jgi:hypothetical protein
VTNVETFCIIMRKYAQAQKFDEAVYTFQCHGEVRCCPQPRCLQQLALCALQI